MKKLLPLLSIFIVLFFTCKKNQTQEANQAIKIPNEIAVKTFAIQTSTSTNTIHTLGIVKSEAEAKPSFKTGGILLKTLVREGQMVKAGQTLALLSMTEIDAQVNQALEGKQKAERDLQRVKNLYADSVATLEQLQNAKSAFEFAMQNYTIASFNKSHSICKSPISGKVIKQIMHTGEIVGPGMPIYAILGLDNRDWKLQVSLTDRDWARIKTHDKAKVNFNTNPNNNYDAYVDDKASLSTNASGTFDVDLKFSKVPKDLAVGLTANVEILPSVVSKNIQIPIEALTSTNGNNATVFILENNTAKKRKIKILQILGEMVNVSSGLENISEIVTTGAMYLEDGDPIRKID